MKTLIHALCASIVMLSSGSAALAQTTLVGATQSDAMSHGEVKKIDKSAGKLTIKHGPLKNLGMDAMTMVFLVKDPAMLDRVKPGDKINFVAEQPNGKLTVMQLEKQN